MEFHLIPKYRAIGVVEALKIKKVYYGGVGTQLFIDIVFEDERFKQLREHPKSIEPRPYASGDYWVRYADGSTGGIKADAFDEGYKPATEITPDLLKGMRSIVAKDLISDEEISKLNQMVYNELFEENQGVIGGPDVIHMQHPARLAEAVTEMVLNKLSAMA